MASNLTGSELHVQLLFMLGQLDSDYHCYVRKGNFWRSMFFEPRACNAWNHTNQNNSVIF